MSFLALFDLINVTVSSEMNFINGSSESLDAVFSFSGACEDGFFGTFSFLGFEDLLRFDGSGFWVDTSPSKSISGSI